jgi:hypothetical protein
VAAARPAACFAMDNERLHAAIKAQPVELRTSRRRIMAAGDRERAASGAEPSRWRVATTVAFARLADGQAKATRPAALKASSELAATFLAKAAVLP